ARRHRPGDGGDRHAVRHRHHTSRYAAHDSPHVVPRRRAGRGGALLGHRQHGAGAWPRHRLRATGVSSRPAAHGPHHRLERQECDGSDCPRRPAGHLDGAGRRRDRGARAEPADPAARAPRPHRQREPANLVILRPAGRRIRTSRATDASLLLSMTHGVSYMPTLNLSLGLFPTESPGRMVELTRLAEDLGFSCAWIGDSQMIWREAYVILGAAALATSRITLATGVTNPVTRDPAVVAAAMETLHELSGGRA